MFFAVSPHRLRRSAARTRSIAHCAWFAAALALAALLVACGATPGASTGSTASASVPTIEALFPRTIVDATGTSVVVAASPQRIVALTPASVETLASLALADRVVGIAECTCTPAVLEEIPIVASYEGVDIEQLITLEPDLVIVGGSGFTPVDAIAALRTAGLTVITVDPKGVDGVYATLQLIGDAVGESVAIGQIIEAMRAEIATLVAVVPTDVQPKVFYEIDATTTIYGIAPDDYVAELIALAGGVPVTSGSPGVYEISLEALVAAAPEVILLGDAAYGTTAAAVGARPGWSTLPAVESGAIRAVDGDLITTPGVRLPEALATLIEAIHPELAPLVGAP